MVYSLGFGAAPLAGRPGCARQGEITGRSRFATSSRASSERRSVSIETLKQHGLGLVIFPNALLDHDRAEAPLFDDQKALVPVDCRSDALGR